MGYSMILPKTHIEDYDLWSRALPKLRFANIPEPLLQYRLHGSNTGKLHGAKQHEGRMLIYCRLLSSLNIEFAQGDLLLHEKVAHISMVKIIHFYKTAQVV